MIIHIVLICDDFYVMPTSVAIASLASSKDKNTTYHTHVLYNGDNKQYESLLKGQTFPGFMVDVINMTDYEKYASLKIDKLHVSPTALYKFDIPHLFPDLDKILYLDCDILVQKDLSELFSTDISDKYAGVVKDMKPLSYKPSILDKLQINHQYYFNSGVMLLNLKKLRNDDIPSKLMEYRQNGINFFMDQDALNVVFQENVTYLSLLDNLISTDLDFFSVDELKRKYGLAGVYTKKEIIKNARILHLASKYKPWVYETPILSQLFSLYYAQSPFKEQKLQLAKLPADKRPSFELLPDVLRYVARKIHSIPVIGKALKLVLHVKRHGLRSTAKAITRYLRSHKNSPLLKLPYRIYSLIKSASFKSKCFLYKMPKKNGLYQYKDREQKIIVSLTTIPSRIQAVSIVIGALLRQTCKPDKILLYLASDEFQSIKMPLALRLQEKMGLEICYCKNLKPHKKYFFTMQRYPNDIVITVDDDVMYDKRLVEQLLECHKKNPHAVCSMRIHEIAFDEDLNIRPYEEWKRNCAGPVNIPAMQFFSVGVGGVLYPPHCMHPQVFYEDKFAELCPMADDIWLKIMQVLNNTPVVLAKKPKELKYLNDTQEIALWRTNVIAGQNDLQFKRVECYCNTLLEDGSTILSRIQKGMEDNTYAV